MRAGHALCLWQTAHRVRASKASSEAEPGPIHAASQVHYLIAVPRHHCTFTPHNGRPSCAGGEANLSGQPERAAAVASQGVLPLRPARVCCDCGQPERAATVASQFAATI